MSRETALKQSNAMQCLIVEHMRKLGEMGYSWALTGGETTDDGTTVRMTICLETRYATNDQAQSIPV